MRAHNCYKGSPLEEDRDIVCTKALKVKQYGVNKLVEVEY